MKPRGLLAAQTKNTTSLRRPPCPRGVPSLFAKLRVDHLVKLRLQLPKLFASAERRGATRGPGDLGQATRDAAGEPFFGGVQQKSLDFAYYFCFGPYFKRFLMVFETFRKQKHVFLGFLLANPRSVWWELAAIYLNRFPKC